MIFVPVLILLHECGHYFAAKAFGLKAEIHSSETTIHVPEPVPPHIKRVTVAAGPSVDALLTAGGFLWLWYSRRSRPQTAATITDWLATLLVTDGLRWLRCF